MSSYLEGYLNKWTNYYSGWQPRWFILNGGILSYYLSSNDVQLGCKGSVKVASCDIIAHNKDHQRIDLIIKGGRRMYIKANSKSERKKWLAAFGSDKQQELTLEASSVTLTQGDIVKSRMVDLHRSCQLLVKHIAQLKSSLSNKDTLNETNLDSISTALSNTCDDFLNTLAECMDLCYDDGHWPQQIKPLSVHQSQASCSSPITLNKKQQQLGMIRTSSNGFSVNELYSATPLVTAAPLSSPRHVKSFAPPPAAVSDNSLPFHLQKHPPTIDITLVQNSNTTTTPTSNALELSVELKDINPRQHTSRSNSDLFLTPTTSPAPSSPPSSSPPPSPPPSPPSSLPPPSSPPSSLNPPPPSSPATNVSKMKQQETFFSNIPHKFADVEIDKDTNGIPSEEFLSSARAALPFFDLLSPTAFAPVKSDINWNIEKIYRKYNENPKLYKTLQDIVLHELNNRTHNVSNSATDALMWLKRALQFVQAFTAELVNGETNLSVAGSRAYSKSLSKYHNFLVRGIFNLAVKAAPYYSGFLQLLGSDGSHESEQVVLEDMAIFSKSVEKHVTILNQFYLQHQLDS